MKVNIGAGRTYVPGFVNVDIVPWADVSVDLESEPLPFEDGSVQLIFSGSTLEHLSNYLGVMAELHRVLVDGGWLLLSLPYLTLTEYNLVNPYHKHRGFTEHSFAFFDPKRLKGSAVERGHVVFSEVFHRFHYLPEFEDEPESVREWSRRHLFNVVQTIDFGLVKGARSDEVNAEQMREEMNRVMCSRVRYAEKCQ